MKIIAHHAHVFQEQVRAEGSISSLKSVMDECSIDQAVCFAPFSKYFQSENGESANKWLYEQIKNEERLLGFGTIDFTRDDLKDQTEEIFALGLSGIKMHPAFQKFKIDDDRACQVYEVAQKRGLPISFHTGIHWHRIADYNTLLYDEVAYRFPELKICMEHVGGYSFFNEAVAVMSNNRTNVFAGLTSVFDRGQNKYWYLGEEKVRDLIWLTGIDRCVFGLDFPYNNAEKIKEAIQSMNHCLDSLGLGEEEKAKVFGGNLLRMIGKQEK
ncbi:MAG: amidohydrolase family protein [Lachnospiraceae bacterium]|nr:amidohydrolase family protein [Lachnospiraceae bacterium]